MQTAWRGQENPDPWEEWVASFASQNIPPFAADGTSVGLWKNWDIYIYMHTYIYTLIAIYIYIKKNDPLNEL